MRVKDTSRDKLVGELMDIHEVSVILASYMNINLNISSKFPILSLNPPKTIHSLHHFMPSYQS